MIWNLEYSLPTYIASFYTAVKYGKILGYKWPKFITSMNLNKVTNQSSWSTIMKQRKLRWWLGHLKRLNPGTPAQKIFEECLWPVLSLIGRLKTTRFKNIKKDIEPITTLGIRSTHTGIHITHTGIHITIIEPLNKYTL